MAWLYVPGVEVSKEELALHSEAITDASVTSNAKRLQSRDWSRLWKQANYIRLLSGMTLNRSIANDGVDAFISSALEFPARETQWQVSDLDKTMRETCGPTFVALLRKYGQASCSLRTSAAYSLFPMENSSAEFLPILKEWITQLRSTCLARRKSALRTRESESSSSACWPTPNVPNGGRTSNSSNYRADGSKQQAELSAVVSLWPTANAHDGRRPGSDETSTQRANLKKEAKFWPTVRAEDSEACGNHPQAVDSLTGAASQWGTPRVTTNGGIPCPESTGKGSRIEDQADVFMTEHWKTPHGMGGIDSTGKLGSGGEFAKQVTNWPTPRAAENGSDSGSAQRLKQGANPGLKTLAKEWPTAAARDGRTPNALPLSERGGGTKGEQLPNFVEHIFHSSLPDQASSTAGEPCLPSTPDSHPRRLSPIFVAWLQNWPLTALGISACSEMASCHSVLPTPFAGYGWLCDATKWRERMTSELRKLLA